MNEKYSDEIIHYSYKLHAQDKERGQTSICT